MYRKCFQWVGIGVIALISTGAGAADLNALSFRAGGLYATNSSGDTYTGLLGWAPVWALSDRWDLGIGIAGSVFKSGLGGNFGVLDLSLRGAYALSSPIWLEASAGTQTWFNRTTAVAAGLNGIWRFSSPWLGKVDRAYVGYEYVGMTATTSEIQAGIGASL